MVDTLRDIGAQMANVMFNFAQLPGERITVRQAEVMRDLSRKWDAAVRATPPSPSTAPAGVVKVLQDALAAALDRDSPAPEVDERAAFETWVTCLAPGHALAREPSGRYSADCNEWAWDGWQARAALASRPADTSLHAVHDKEPTKSVQRAEVDDEGLPQAEAWKFRGYDGQEGCHSDIWQLTDSRRAMEIHQHNKALIEPLYTAEQFRQGQRDAVAADRARRDQRQSAVPSGRVALTFSDVFELYSAADALHEAGAIVAGVNVRLIADKLVDVGSGAGWK